MRFTVRIVGHSGEGNHGHGMEVAFVGVQGAEAGDRLDTADGRAEQAAPTVAKPPPPAMTK